MFRKLKQKENVPIVAAVPERAVAPVVQPKREVVEESQVEEEQETQKQSEQEEITEEKIIGAIAEDRNLLIQHDARISAIEAALFRLKALV